MKKNHFLISALSLFLFTYSCQNSVDETKSSEKIEIQQVENLPEITIVGEHHINDQAITNHPNVKVGQKSTEMSKEDHSINYKSLQASDIHSLFTKQYQIVDKNSTSDKPEGTIINKMPLDETQTYIAFDNSKWIGSIAVISDKRTGEVDQIVFSDSTHTDVYNVKLGMTATQVAALRKEMKFIEHNGSKYLYAEDSNIMYLVDVKDANGTESDELKMGKSTVTAIIWKDKNHSKHPNKIKKSKKQVG